LLNTECQHILKKPGSCVHSVSSPLETVLEDAGTSSICPVTPTLLSVYERDFISMGVFSIV